MPRYTAKCLVEQTTNGDTARQFIEAMKALGHEVVVVKCPTYYYGKSYRQFKFECPNPNLAVINGQELVFDIKRLRDEDDTGKSWP